MGEHTLPAGPTGQISAAHSSIKLSQEGQAGFACLCCASSLRTGISISRAVNTAPFKDSEFSLETGR